jgi:hypothetical protein
MFQRIERLHTVGGLGSWHPTQFQAMMGLGLDD